MKTREQIFQVELPWSEVEIPEWDGTFRVRSLSAAEMEGLASQLEGDDQHARAALAVLVVCDQDGQRMFEDCDVQRLSETQAFTTLDRVWRVAAPMNGMTGKND